MSNRPRTIRLLTLGCKVNQYETQYVKETLEINGYREAEDGERADLCVVNTCTVTMEKPVRGAGLDVPPQARAEIKVFTLLKADAASMAALVQQLFLGDLSNEIRSFRCSAGS